MENEIIITDNDFKDYGFSISDSHFMCKEYILDYRDGFVKLQDYETERTEEEIELFLSPYDDNRNEPIDIRILSNLQAIHYSLTGEDLKKQSKEVSRCGFSAEETTIHIKEMCNSLSSLKNKKATN